MSRNKINKSYSLNISALGLNFDWCKLTICPEYPAYVHQNWIVLRCNTGFNRFHSKVPQVSWGQSVVDHPLWRRSWEKVRLPMTCPSLAQFDDISSKWPTLIHNPHSQPSFTTCLRSCWGRPDISQCWLNYSRGDTQPPGPNLQRTWDHSRWLCVCTYVCMCLVHLTCF